MKITTTLSCTFLLILFLYQRLPQRNGLPNYERPKQLLYIRNIYLKTACCAPSNVSLPSLTVCMPMFAIAPTFTYIKQ